MAYAVQYLLVDVRGAAFNAALDPDQAASPSELNRFNLAGAEWEFTLPRSRIRAGADLSSDVATLVHLSINYSLLVHSNAEAIETVEEADTILRKLFPGKHILRFDEILLEQWLAGQDQDHLLANKANVERFMHWILSQDPTHWKQVQ